jgi:hypothetical protein
MDEARKIVQDVRWSVNGKTQKKFFFIEKISLIKIREITEKA